MFVSKSANSFSQIQQEFIGGTPHFYYLAVKILGKTKKYEAFIECGKFFLPLPPLKEKMTKKKGAFLFVFWIFLFFYCRIWSLFDHKFLGKNVKICDQKVTKFCSKKNEIKKKKGSLFLVIFSSGGINKTFLFLCCVVSHKDS